MSICNEFWHTPPNDFLASLDDVARSSLLSIATSQHFKQRQHIFRAGSPGNNLYILKSGRAKIYSLSPAGKEVILWFCIAGEVFGLTEISNSGMREVSAVAYTDAEFLIVQHDRFREFLLAHPDTSLLLIDLLSVRMRMLGSLILAMATEDVSSRFLKLLNGLLVRYGQPCNLHSGCNHYQINLRLTHQEIADMIGTTRQSVSSLIGNLKQRGILFVHNHLIHIQNRAELATMAGQGKPSALASPDSTHIEPNQSVILHHQPRH